MTNFPQPIGVGLRRMLKTLGERLGHSKEKIEADDADLAEAADIAEQARQANSQFGVGA